MMKMSVIRLSRVDSGPPLYGSMISRRRAVNVPFAVSVFNVYAAFVYF